MPTKSKQNKRKLSPLKQRIIEKARQQPVTSAQVGASYQTMMGLVREGHLKDAGLNEDGARKFSAIN